MLIHPSNTREPARAPLTLSSVTLTHLASCPAAAPAARLPPSPTHAVQQLPRRLPLLLRRPTRPHRQSVRLTSPLPLLPFLLLRRPLPTLLGLL